MVMKRSRTSLIVNRMRGERVIAGVLLHALLKVLRVTGFVGCSVNSKTLSPTFRCHRQKRRETGCQVPRGAKTSSPSRRFIKLGTACFEAHCNRLISQLKPEASVGLTDLFAFPISLQTGSKTRLIVHFNDNLTDNLITQ